MYLLYVYVASLVVGGILLLASLVLGHDSDVDVDADVDLDVDAHVELDADAHVDGGGAGDIWLPFFSLRFWVFFLAFFGVTGTALTLLGLAGRWTTLGAALAMGALIGLIAAVAIHKLKRDVVGEVADEQAFKGKDATVLLPLSRGQRGKVRVTVNEQAVDLVARTDEAETLAVGCKVLVIDVVEGQLVVVPAPDLKS